MTIDPRPSVRPGREPRRVLLVEAWLGGSHRYWADGLHRHSRHEIEVIGLPARMWRWRLRAGAIDLTTTVRERLSGGEVDLLLVSSLVDLSSLLGLVRPPPDLPVVLYLHESQLLYPMTDGNPDSDAVVRNWCSLEAADRVWINSAHHRDALAAALPTWGGRQPEPLDPVPVLERLRSAVVLPVGIDAPPERARPDGGPPIVLWPHRWEADKAPEVFAAAVDRLVGEDIPFRLVLAGEDPMASDVRRRLLAAHADRIAAVGPLERDEYRHWLGRADIVVSCARHEFFGIAVAEAGRAGALPVVPDALAYPEVLRGCGDDAMRYRPGRFGSALAETLALDPPERRRRADAVARALARYEWPTLIRAYDDAIDSVP